MKFELKELNNEYIIQFKKDMQEAFQYGYESKFGKCEDVILPEEDIDRSLNTKGAMCYVAYLNNIPCGGCVVIIDEKTQNNSLDFLYVKVGSQSKGIGLKIWKEIEKIYMNTKIWHTCTPYFDTRNIHFYVNKCHFKIIEYFNEYHREKDMSFDEYNTAPDHDEGMFEFEKEM